MKKKTIRKIRSLILLIALTSLLLIFTNNNTTGAVPKTSLIELNYTVKVNDTLWSIARKHNYDNKEIRKFIAEIEDFNNLDCVIRPGEVIVIPVSSEGVVKAEQLATN